MSILIALVFSNIFYFSFYQPNSRNNFIVNKFIETDTSTTKYFEIIEGLKKDYILYYRSLIKMNSDLKAFGIIANDSIFLVDSVTYHKSYQSFFQQDYNFIRWLLSFKNDTLESGLWQKSPNPLSSYNIEECHLPMNNSMAAINLIENFLNGEGFECYVCKYDNRKCNMMKYEEIEKFLGSNKTKNICLLRNYWQLKNAR